MKEAMSQSGDHAQSDLSEFARVLDVPPYQVIREGYLPDNVLVHFHFAPHATAEHFEGAKELLPDADIFIPEISAWDESDVKLYTAISKGDRKIFDRCIAGNEHNLIRDWYNTVHRALFDTWKPVLFIDYSADQAGDLAMAKTLQKQLEQGLGSDLDEALHRLADIEAQAMQKSATRNRLMVGNLGTKVTELVSGHPKLKDKPLVRVLAPMGFGHMPIYDYLHGQPDSSNNVSASSWSGVGELSASDRVGIGYLQGRAPTRDDMFAVLATRAMETVPSVVYKGESMYSARRDYMRQPDTEQMVAKEVVNIMKSQEDGQQLALNRVNGIRSQEDAEQLHSYIERANQSVFEATGQAIDLS